MVRYRGPDHRNMQKAAAGSDLVLSMHYRLLEHS